VTGRGERPCPPPSRTAGCGAWSGEWGAEGGGREGVAGSGERRAQRVEGGGWSVHGGAWRVERGAGRLLLTCLVLLSTGPARAQDALRSALSLQPVIQQAQFGQVNLQPDRPHLGPVQLALGVYGGLELNDNVNTSEFDRQSDLLLRGGLNLGFFWPATTQSQLNFGSSIGYVHYLKNSQYDHAEVAPNSALSWAVGFDDGSITFFDQFSYSQQVLAESALSGLATFPRLNNTIGARVDWLPGRWAFEIGYSHNTSFSESSEFQYLNSDSEYFFARGAWRFAENTQAGIEASSSLTRYELVTQNDNYSVSLGPYADWQITQALHATLRGGPVFYVFEAPPGPTRSRRFDSYYLGFDVSHRLTDFFSHTVSVRRSVQQGLNQGSAYVEELTASYWASAWLTQRISLGANFAYTQGNQPYQVPITIYPFGTFIFQEIENYDRYSGTLSASWRATDKLNATLAYSHYLRDSNVAGNRYSVNSLALTVTYNF